MALIDMDKIKRIRKDAPKVHEEAEATYSIFEIHGKKYLQIDTYGKSTREYAGKLSQTIQLDENSLEHLAAILKDEFNL